MDNLKVAFSNFYPSFKENDNIFLKILSSAYSVELVHVEEQPDIIFYSCFGGYNHYKCKNAIRIYYTGENDVPNFNVCDYGISFHYLNFGNRHYRLPLYCLYKPFNLMLNGNYLAVPNLTERKFCSIVVSNSDGHVRNLFWEKLSSYKTIASGGKFNNNVGFPVKNKYDFIKN